MNALINVNPSTSEIWVFGGRDLIREGKIKQKQECEV
jgi:hypothetical protein